MKNRRAIQFRKLLEAQTNAMPDETIAEFPDFVEKWATDTDYKTGDRRAYNSVVYKCLQDHKSLDTWTPEDAPSLWAKVLIPDPDVIPDWEQPSSTNPYMKGDKVRFDGKVWISEIDNNVWQPNVYGWTEVL